MADLKSIRTRIRSVQSIKKITRAMELIATSRIVKAEQRVGESRSYAVAMARVLGNLAAATGGAVQHPLLERHEETKASAVLVLCSDRGLCGPYNTGVLKLAEEAFAELPGTNKSVVAVGRKASSYFGYRKMPILQVFDGISDNPSYADAKRVADFLIEKYLTEELDHIEMVYTSFHSQVRQSLRSTSFLPIDTSELSEVEEKGGKAALHTPVAAETSDAVTADTLFEPDAAGILEVLIPKGIQSRLYSAMLDAAASEHTARRRAMKAATDNAGELVDALTLQYNKARQAAITTEILEVVSGAEALATA